MSTGASCSASQRPAMRCVRRKSLFRRGTVDLSALDEKVEALCTKLLYTFPDCTTKTVEELRKPKLDAWNRNKENSRAWLALNMMTEGARRIPCLQFRNEKDRPRNRLHRLATRTRRQHALVRRTDGRHQAAGAAPAHEHQPLKVWFDADGRLLRLRLSAPKANLIDAVMIAALQHGARRARRQFAPRCRPADADGPHFSFGASSRSTCRIDAQRCSPGFHPLILHMIESPVPILVAVHGQCLGGGLELATAAHLLFVGPDAKLAQPEIQIGVFARRRRVCCPNASDCRGGRSSGVGPGVIDTEAAALGIANDRGARSRTGGARLF